MTSEAIVALRHKIPGLPTWEFFYFFLQTPQQTKTEEKKPSSDTDQVAYTAHCVHV